MLKQLKENTKDKKQFMYKIILVVLIIIFITFLILNGEKIREKLLEAIKAEGIIESVTLPTGTYTSLFPDSTNNKAVNGTVTERKTAITTIGKTHVNDYAKMTALDTLAFRVPGDTTGLDTYVIVNFTQIPANPYAINVSARVNSTTAGTVHMALWDFTNTIWVAVSQATSANAVLLPLEFNVTPATISDYVSGTEMRVFLYDNSSGQEVFSVDYVYLNVSNGAVSDTCSYTSGDWNIDCGDACTISSPITGDNSNMVMSGAGTIVLNNNVSGFLNYYLRDGCNLICREGCILD